MPITSLKSIKRINLREKICIDIYIGREKIGSEVYSLESPASQVLRVRIVRACITYLLRSLITRFFYMLLYCYMFEGVM